VSLPRLPMYYKSKFVLQMESIDSSILSKSQRPCVMIHAEGYGREYPADVHCMLTVKNNADEEVDVVFVQYYEHVYTAKRTHEPETHPFVPSAQCYYLGDSLAVYSVDAILRPARLVPVLDSGSPREPKHSKRVSTAATGSIYRPRFYCLESLLG
jgi:hypothetical protein